MTKKPPTDADPTEAPPPPAVRREPKKKSKTKKKIVEQIAHEHQVSQVLAKKIVQMTFDQIVETLVQFGRIELRNFGVFEVRIRKSRKARNPKTDEPVEVPEKKVVTFQPGKVMEEKVKHALKVAEPKKKGKKGDVDDTDDAELESMPADETPE